MVGKQKVTRKLRAILSADVKGYSTLMTNNEASTIQTLKKYRQIMSGLIKQHYGRVVDAPGDNLLAEFPSAVEAVQCSVKIQNALKEKNDSRRYNCMGLVDIRPHAIRARRGSPGSSKRDHTNKPQVFCCTFAKDIFA